MQPALASLSRLLAEHGPLTAAPVGADLVTATVDAGGRRLELARRHKAGVRLGADLVNRSVNALLSLGATPVALHLFAGTDAVAPAMLDDLFEGLTRGCRGNFLPLAGATPVRGSSLGVTVVGRRVGMQPVEEGDRLIGLASSGLSPCDFESVAALLLDRLALAPDDAMPGAEGTVADALFAPAKSYRGVLLEPLAKGWVHALAPVGAGGLSAAISGGLGGRIEPGSWPQPPVVAALCARAGPWAASVLNLGIGLVAAVPPPRAEEFRAWMAAWNEPCWEIGAVSRA